MSSTDAAGIADLSIRFPLLTSWTLWRRLFHPDHHPLFRRTLNLPIRPLTALWIVPLIGIFACCGTWALLIPFQTSIIALLPLLLIAFSSSYASVWAMRISAAIVREHECGSYDHFSVTPLGALGVSWVLCTATLHRDDAIGWIDAGRKLLAGLLSLALAASLVTTALRETTIMPLQFVPLLLELAALVAAFYADHVQSIVLGSLAGMYAPTRTQQHVEAPFLAEVLFLILQAAVGLAVFSIPTVVHPGLNWIARRIGLNLEVDPLAMSLTAFYLIREAFIIALWNALVRRLNGETAAADLP